MCSMTRRFVHLITNDLQSGGYALRNIDMKPLFAGVVGTGKGIRTTLLPRPVACFESHDKNKLSDFFYFDSKIVNVNSNLQTVLYDTFTSTMRVGPEIRHGKYFQSAWAALRGRLYVANELSGKKGGRPWFQSLGFDNSVQDWVWELLPLPPFLDMPFGIDCAINTYAAVDDKTIWMSTRGKGTYTFDITAATWSKEGDWALPFMGHMLYIPEYNQCFGFSQGSSELCSANLIVGSGEPPVHRAVWDDVGYTGSKWHLACSHLTYLGCGRFCVTRFYDTSSECFIPLCRAAVMTAVEATHTSEGELQMIKGASRCYKFPGATSGWAL